MNKRNAVILGATIVAMLAAFIVVGSLPVEKFVDDYGTDYGAVLVLNFEEGTGTTAFDQSPYGNDGTIVDAAWTAGKYGEALTFDGNDYVSITDSASLDISDYITIEAWAKDPPFVGARVEAGSATVDTSATRYAVTLGGYQRKGFHAAGRFWAFYTNGTIAVYESTANPEDWSGSVTSIGTANRGDAFSVWFDGTYIHYTIAIADDLFYRRGIPESDGSITWSAVEQTVYDGSSGDKYGYPSICVDTNGYAWIGAWSDQPDDDDFPVVLKNSENDGTWTTEVGFDPYELSAVDNPSWKVCPVPLTDGKVYVIYCLNNQLPLGNLWNGAAWVGEENDLADYNIKNHYAFSAVADGDDVHFAYTRDVTYQIRHNRRVWGVGWNVADVLVQDAVLQYCSSTLSFEPITSDLYCFWTSTVTDHVYYKKYSGGSWGDLVDWIDESIDAIEYDFLPSSWYQNYGGYIGLLYVTKLASPYNVRFAYLTVGAPEDPVNDACDSDARFADDTYGWVNVTVSDLQGIANLATVDIQVNTTGDAETFTLRWTQASDIFSEVSDASNICTLNAATSTTVNIDADTVRVCFYFKITDGTVGDCDVRATSTDDEAHTDVDTYSNEFEYAYVYKVIVEKIDAYALYIEKTNILYGQINSTRVSYTVTTITDWHYYAMTYDGVTLKLYVDGELVASTALAIAIPLNNNNVTIGTRFLGEIDQVRIYNVAKTLGEIRNHYLNSGHMYSGSVTVSDDFRILDTTFGERIGLDNSGLDLNHYYVLNSDFSHWMHFTFTAGVTDIKLNVVGPGILIQDRHIHRITLTVDTAPGAGKEVNITLTNGVDTMFVDLIDLETEDWTETGEFNWDVSDQPLTLTYSQSAGGLTEKGFVTIKYHYKETP